MKKLSIDERMFIQACLHKELNITEIAKRLNRNKSTISRELSRHFRLVEGPQRRYCSKINQVIVCNRCVSKRTCLFNKRYYDFKEANDKTERLRSESKRYTRLSKDKIKIIDDILLDEVRNLKQSLHHVYVANPSLKNICSERTIRRLIYRHEVSIKPHELRKYVVFKHEYNYTPTKRILIKDLSVIVGRQYSDYLNYTNRHKSLNVAQYDSIIGQKTDYKALLTITLVKYNFQFGIVYYKDNPKDLVSKIKALFSKIGNDNVKRIFPINLSDNGIEFSNFNEIEYDVNGEKICRTYFTRPYKATDKPICEREHEYVRYFIPKGRSLNRLTQSHANYMFSQIASFVRKGQHDSTPYDLVRRRFGQEFLDSIGIQRIDKKKVNLRQLSL